MWNVLFPSFDTLFWIKDSIIVFPFIMNALKCSFYQFHKNNNSKKTIPLQILSWTNEIYFNFIHISFLLTFLFIKLIPFYDNQLQSSVCRGVNWVGYLWASLVQFTLGGLWTHPINKWANWTIDQLVHGPTG